MHWVCWRAVLSLGRALPHCGLKTRMQLRVVTTAAEGLHVHRGVAPEENVPCVFPTPLRAVFITLFYGEVEAWRGDFSKEAWSLNPGLVFKPRFPRTPVHEAGLSDWYRFLNHSNIKSLK